MLTAVGSIIALPFSAAWAGWMLFAGLLIHFSSRLLGGRAGIAQMLGLTALAAAPSVLLAVNHLLGLLGAVTNISLAIPISILALVLAIWSAAIYVKATAVAQNFSIARALGAVVLAFVLFLGAAILLGILFGILVGVLVAPIASSIQ